MPKLEKFGQDYFFKINGMNGRFAMVSHKRSIPKFSSSKDSLEPSRPRACAIELKFPLGQNY
ncbi:hypothetical protein B7486_51990 [cyanobacterium TDX16]|nr:hypothetical protein B7486_51990 [cyanobacterium TDX16]